MYFLPIFWNEFLQSFSNYCRQLFDTDNFNINTLFVYTCHVVGFYFLKIPCKISVKCQLCYFVYSHPQTVDINWPTNTLLDFQSLKMIFATFQNISL